MVQIFISHSAKDEQGISFFAKVFSTTNVKAIFEEYEKLTGLPINSKKIQEDINKSECIFILLDENIEQNKHTRDWVSWECGYGSQNNKDVWVFEKQKDYEKITLVTPSLKHYVRYNPDDNWFHYIQTIIKSYDNSNVNKNTLLGTTIGGIISDDEDKIAGLVLGAFLGNALSKKNLKVIGEKVKCIYCLNSYIVHVPKLHPFRCPVCNKSLKFDS